MAAAESALARYSGQPFAWGERDCLRLAAHALRALGHTPPLRAAGEYRTLIGAHRALKRTGYPDLSAWIDSWGLRRIAPALRLPADIVALPSEMDTMPALAVSLSEGRVLAFLPDLGRAAPFALRPGVVPVAAWSV